MSKHKIENEDSDKFWIAYTNDVPPIVSWGETAKGQVTESGAVNFNVYNTQQERDAILLSQFSVNAAAVL